MNKKHRDDSLMRVIKRSLEIINKEGLKSFWFRILGETIYRRVLIFECIPDNQLHYPKIPFPITISLLDKTEVNQFIEFRPDIDQADILKRFHNNEMCFVVRNDNRIISAVWVRTTQAFVEYLGREVYLAPDEAYVYDTFTAPEFRGYSIPVARFSYLSQYLRDLGYHRLIIVVFPENRPGLRNAEKTGFIPIGKMGYFRLGQWCYYFCLLKKESRIPGRFLEVCS
jgi:GNAT superfamily N-acetyltransferase